MEQYILFMGNPGAGKSTLLNALVGRLEFRSGISPGKGLTTDLQVVEEPPESKIFYGDTPGLADVTFREEAAKEITKALRKNGRYKLVFVVTEESLLARPQDVATINLILDAIELENGNKDVPYGIIVNKITQKRFARLYENNEQMKRFQDCFTQKHRACDFHFYLHDEALEDEDDALHKPTTELLTFLDDLGYVNIEPTQVADITTKTSETNEQDQLQEPLEDLDIEPTQVADIKTKTSGMNEQDVLCQSNPPGVQAKQLASRITKTIVSYGRKIIKMITCMPQSGTDEGVNDKIVMTKGRGNDKQME